MKISYNWLKTYINTALSPQEMGEILTQTGLEVEAIEKIEAVKGGLEGVVVGEVISCEKHPDADKLKVTTVNIGSETLQIVCEVLHVASIVITTFDWKFAAQISTALCNSFFAQSGKLL